jgi:hypothetical protein
MDTEIKVPVYEISLIYIGGGYGYIFVALNLDRRRQKGY